MTRNAADGDGRVLAPPAHGEVEPLETAPTFSVLIAVYQGAETIGDAVASALAQTYRAAEVIVVDDGSTDDLVTALRPHMDEITLVSKDNGGAASARNAGLEAASGDFIAALDADDRFHPRRLEALAGLASLRPDLDLLATDMRFIVDDEEVGRFLAGNRFAIEDQRSAIVRNCFVGGLPAVRARRLREVGGFDESLKIGSDWDCWLRLILNGSAAGMVDRPYYDYVLHRGTLTSSRADSLWARVRLLEKAAVNPDLRPRERPLLKRELRRRRSGAVLEEARAAAREGRRLSPAAATGRGIAWRARLVATGASIAPWLAWWLIRKRMTPEERLSAADR